METIKQAVATALIIALSLLFFIEADAKVIPNPIFADNMVLQQNAQVAFWGEAKAGAKVKITPSWSRKSVRVQADADGKWITRIATPSAGGPYENVLEDGEKTRISNVLIGEVWLCSGQSNMEMPVKGWPGQPIAGSADYILGADAQLPVRHCYVKRETALSVREKCTATWRESRREGVAESSAYA